MTSEFEPEVLPQGLTDEVEEARDAYYASLDSIDAVLQPRIEGHLLVLQECVATLTLAHTSIVDESDIDLSAKTRWVALWELSGRCLAMSNLLLAELRLGFAPETAGTIRVLDEAVVLLHGFLADDERADDIVRRWLDGEVVMPRDVRPLLGAEQDALAAAMEERGVEPGGDVVELGRQIYDLLSKGVHNARSGFGDSVSRVLRLFSYGPHSDARKRAVYVDYASGAIEAVALSVGSALARFFGGEWYRDTVPAMQHELEAVREAMPVDAEARGKL